VCARARARVCVKRLKMFNDINQGKK